MPIAKDMATRYQKFVAKTAPDRVGARYGAVKDIAVSRFLEGASRVRSVVDTVKDVLDVEGVPAGMYALYISFAEYIAKHAISFKAGTFKNRVLGAIANWTARGADPKILTKIVHLLLPGITAG